MHDHESIILQPSEDSNVGDIRAGRPCREKKKEKNVNMRHKQTERGTKNKNRIKTYRESKVMQDKPVSPARVM